MNSKWRIGSSNIYAEIEIDSWIEFIEFIESTFIDFKDYLYRGHRDSEWELESTFDRMYHNSIEKIKKENPDYIIDLQYEEILRIHLDNFKKNSIGRLLSPSRNLTENEWWALGQHYNLATPLLDWSQSPYIALFFALENWNIPNSNLRTLWIFSPLSLKDIAINQEPKSEFIEEIDSPSDENLRLRSQLGKFTKTPKGLSIEKFILKHIKLTGFNPILYRVNIPENLRDSFLRHLNSMNINHATIYPDLIGASGNTNRELEVLLYKKSWEKGINFVTRLLDFQLFHE